MSKTVSSLDQGLLHAIKSSWARETSYEPELWSIENPAWGQCAVTSLVVQDYLGGELLRATDGHVIHFWNLVDGTEIDLTFEQFSVQPEWTAAPELVDRDYVLESPDTCRRYETLRRRTAKSLGLG